MLAFFVLRVLPVQYLGDLYVRGHFLVETRAPKMGLIDSSNAYGCGLKPVEWWTSVISIPIPVALNLFWFGKMLLKAGRVVLAVVRGPKARAAATAAAAKPTKKVA